MKTAATRGQRLRPGKRDSAGASRRRRIAASAVLALVVVGVGIVAVGSVVGSVRTPPKHAVIVDQLSLTQPNPAFAREATALLEGAGYVVDYYPGRDASVELYRNLPALGSDFVLLRVHSARREEPTGVTDEAVLFTAELIDLDTYAVSGVPPAAATAIALAKGRAAPIPAATRAAARLAPEELRHVSPVYYDPGSGELPFFGLRPLFVEQDLRGSFADGSTVVLMGCDGLRSSELAEAFLARGAGTFISWDSPVSTTHTDAATLRLLELLLVDERPLAEAIDSTMDEVGTDPVSGARLSSVTNSEEAPRTDVAADK